MITFPAQLEGLSKKEKAAVLSIKKLLIAAVVKHGSTNELAREVLKNVDDLQKSARTEGGTKRRPAEVRRTERKMKKRRRSKKRRISRRKRNDTRRK